MLTNGSVTLSIGGITGRINIQHLKIIINKEI